MAAGAGGGRAHCSGRWPNFALPSIHCALCEWPIIGRSAGSDRPRGR